MIPCLGGSEIVSGATEKIGSSSPAYYGLPVLDVVVDFFLSSSSFFFSYFFGAQVNFYGLRPLFSTKISFVIFRCVY